MSAPLPRGGHGGQREAAPSLSLSCSLAHTQHTHDTLTHAVTLREGGEATQETDVAFGGLLLKSPRLASGCLLSFSPSAQIALVPGARGQRRRSGRIPAGGDVVGGSACEIRWRRLQRRPAAVPAVVSVCVVSLAAGWVGGCLGSEPAVPSEGVGFVADEVCLLRVAARAGAEAGCGGGGGKDVLFVELWKACAGPLSSVPPLGEKVYYFPQGHIEQVREADRGRRRGWGAVSCCCC